MRLSECLNSSDIEILRKIAESYNFDCHRSSKNSLMQTILSHFNNRKFVQETLSNVDSKEYREVLLQLILNKRKTFSKEDLTAMTIRITGNQSDHDKQLVSRLLQEGWIYKLSSQGGKSIFYLPEELVKIMNEFFINQLQNQVTTVESEPVIYRDDHLAMVRDMVQFIFFIKNNEVKITQEGVIFKRQLLQTLNSFEIIEEPISSGWRFGYGRRFHDYPDRFALLYDYCFYQELIEEQTPDVLVLTDKTETWLKQTDKDKLQGVVSFWRLLYRRPIPRLPLIISTIAWATSSAWTLKESVNQLISPYVKEYYYDSQQDVMEKRIYQMMVIMGLLCIGKLADGQEVIKLSSTGKELLLDGSVQANVMEESMETDDSPLIIQPNFDVLLPAMEVSRLGWDLSQFTDLIRADLMRIYRITKASINRGIENGWDTKKIIEFLDRRSGQLLPGNVKRMIEQWGEIHT